MSLSRALVALAAGLFSSMVSLDPRVSAPPRPERPLRHAIAPPAELPPASGRVDSRPLPVLDGAPPADLTVEVLRDPRGRGRNVVVRRPGHLVSLSHGAIRAAGKEWTSMHIDLQGSAQGAARDPEIDRLVWETTPLASLGTERGVVSLSVEGTALLARLLLAAAPPPIARFDGAHHSCAAHRDTSGGFVLLCRFHHGAKQVSALNLTGTRALDGAWVIDTKEPMVRLDLPLSPGLAEARVIGFVHGIHGATIRAEAAWAPGEEPSLLVEESERAQPVATF